MIPDGAVLTGAFATISNLNASGPGTLKAVLRSSAGLASMGLAPLTTEAAGTFDLLPGSPLTGTQNYEFIAVLRDDAAVGETFGFDWELKLTVETPEDTAAIPLPATLPLLLGAMGLTLAAARRRA